MKCVRAVSSAVRAFGLHPKGHPFKSDTAHHPCATPFSGDVVQLVRTLPCHGRGREFESRRPRHFFLISNPQSSVHHRPCTSRVESLSSCAYRSRVVEFSPANSERDRFPTNHIRISEVTAAPSKPRCRDWRCYRPFSVRAQRSREGPRRLREHAVLG